MAINPLQPPINYMGSQINLSEQFSGLGEALQQRQARNLLEDQQKQYVNDFTATVNEPSQKGFANLLAKHGRSPALVSSIESARKQFGEERIKNEFNQGFQISNALEKGNTEVAYSLIKEIVTAKTNSKEPLGLYGQVLNFLEEDNIKAAQGTLNLALSNIDPDQFTKIVNARSTAEAAPSKLTEAIAKADESIANAKIKVAEATNAKEMSDATLLVKQEEAKKEAINAKFLEQEKKLAIRKTEEDIIINKENARIAALNAQISRETNSIKRDELKERLDKAKETRDQADRDQQSTLKSQSADIDNFLNTAQRILNTPQAIVKSAAGPIASRLPTASADVADFEGLVETLGSQAFLAQIPKLKGTGNLTEKEGDKLQTSLQNLSLKQSPARLFENVTEAMRLLGKVRTNITERSGMPAVPRDVPTVPVVRITLPDGRVAQFPNQAAADDFKKKTGIR